MSSEDRVISLGPGLAAIPERLLLAHARGEVIFICGAGISMAAGLPDFRQLVLDVYEAIDPVVHTEIVRIPRGACNKWEALNQSLNHQQRAEVNRFILADYDVVLGMLERRIDGQTDKTSQVRSIVTRFIRHGRSGSPVKPKPAAIHRAIMKLADRGGPSTVVTTNFDLLLEGAAAQLGVPAQTYSLGSIPRPTSRSDFAGVFHIHGAIDVDERRVSNLILTDQDFGDAYLRQRGVPDFIYDLNRLYHLVLVGYSASDHPMRYLLNAVASDESRFPDIKRRYVFTPSAEPDPVSLEDWKGRGITPIQYDSKDGHKALLHTIERWAKLSATNGKKEAVDAELRRIVQNTRTSADEEDRDLFDHLLRRGNASERVRLSSFVSDAKANIEWLDAIIKVCAETERGQRT